VAIVEQVCKHRLIICPQYDQASPDFELQFNVFGINLTISGGRNASRLQNLESETQSCLNGCCAKVLCMPESGHSVRYTLLSHYEVVAHFMRKQFFITIVSSNYCCTCRGRGKYIIISV
jgi:hypothetical protein